MINNLKYFLKLIRWFHELLGILPFTALYFVIKYYSEDKGISCNLSGFNFVLLCIGVQLLMISGFILNDIVDRDIDKINKPFTHIVGRTISLQTAKVLFVIFTILIVLNSVYITYFIFKEWAIISPIVYLLSVAYSLYLKRSPLFGNITMGLLAGFIPLVIMFFARECIQILHNEKINVLIWLYAIFPFLIIVPRELSLDISDMEGDKASGCKTLPIIIGVKKSKLFVAIFLFVVILLSFSVMYRYSYLNFTLCVVDILLLFYLYKLRGSETRIEYIRIGRFLWVIMILGLIGFTISTVY